MHLRRVIPAAFALTVLSACSAAVPQELTSTGYPVHTDIKATTFWAGEIYDESMGVEGQNVASAWDSNWAANYGGCDGVGQMGSTCETETRTKDSDYYPTSMEPQENPFYLALPFDDLNNENAFALRDQLPWADEYDDLSSKDVSLMKNRWVAINGPEGTCYGQIEDAGPGAYDDFDYVFGDAKPQQEYGADLSPALFSCVGLELSQGSGEVSWSFIDRADVPEGPWLRIETTTGVNHTDVSSEVEEALE